MFIILILKSDNKIFIIHLEFCILSRIFGKLISVHVNFPQFAYLKNVQVIEDGQGDR